MFDKLREFLRSVAGENDRRAAFTRDDPRVAMAALFYHVIEADGVVSANEQETLRTALKDAFDLDEQELKALLEAGQKADDEAVDLYRFTSVLRHAFDAEQRIAFIELLWQLVYADGVRDELEDNIVWRVAELLGVSGRDRVLMRQRVAEKSATDGREGNDEG
jgi:uncharacterized tellurite resistance protein B-like protein